MAATVCGTGSRSKEELVVFDRKAILLPGKFLGSIAGSGAPGEGAIPTARSMPPGRFECRGEPDNRVAVRARRIGENRGQTGENRGSDGTFFFPPGLPLPVSTPGRRPAARARCRHRKGGNPAMIMVWVRFASAKPNSPANPRRAGQGREGVEVIVEQDHRPVATISRPSVRGGRSPHASLPPRPAARR